MLRNKISIPFEGGRVSLKVPPGWNIISELGPRSVPGLGNISDALIEGLRNPIEHAPLKSLGLSNKKILIAVDDITRPTPTHSFFSHLLKHLLACGAKKENILIITALGVHRDMRADEVKQKLGDTEGIKWINHNSKDLDEQIDLGKTKRGTHVYLNKHLGEADLVLCVGLIEPHPLLGFGGGLKMILPGLAHERTIAANHMRGVSHQKFNYIGEHESPMRLDLEEAAMMLKKDIFIINAILNEKKEIHAFVSGHPVAAHRRGIKISESISARKIDHPADIAIVASNPMNADLRQGIKAVANIEKSVKENGLIIAFLECKNGLGDIAVPHKWLGLDNTLLRAILKLVGKKRLLWLTDIVKKNTGVEERFLTHFSMQVARKNRLFIYSNNLSGGTGKRLGLFRQFSDIDKMLKSASRYTPKNPTVYVYPYGGVTYPIR